MTASEPSFANTNPRHALTRFERVSLDFADWFNSSAELKNLAIRFNRQASYQIIRFFARSRVRAVGIEHIARAHEQGSVLLAANHRSFFDFYLAMFVLREHHIRFSRYYFPVRSGFWYDHPLGISINLLMSGMAMYPPIFRAPEKREVTRQGLNFIADRLEKPGTLIGIHPEGTRNKNSDPYELLPAEQGFGRVVLRAKPKVIPLFVNGVGNSLLKEWGKGDHPERAPIYLVFGPPVDLQEFDQANPERLRTQIDVGKKVLAAIGELALQERNLRAQIANPL